MCDDRFFGPGWTTVDNAMTDAVRCRHTTHVGKRARARPVCLCIFWRKCLCVCVCTAVCVCVHVQNACAAFQSVVCPLIFRAFELGAF